MLMMGNFQMELIMNTDRAALLGNRMLFKVALIGLMAGIAARTSAQAILPGEELQQALVPAVRLEQDSINNQVSNPHGLPLLKIVRAGRHLFNTPFTKMDGAGEGKRDDLDTGALGPREADFNERLDRIIKESGASDEAELALRKNLAPATAIRDPQDGTPYVNKNNKIRFDFLRVNGLDSQSCFECHNSIGSAHLPGQGDLSLLERKVGVTSGPAGFASDAFIGESIDVQPLEGMMHEMKKGGSEKGGKKNEGEKVEKKLVPFTKLLRNPPHVFGTGYVQKLAEEMTFELHRVERELLFKLLIGQSPATAPVLEAKGVSFGKLQITYKGKPLPADAASAKADQLASSGLLGPEFELDEKSLEGVSEDLVVRPFQWKGIASDERNFVRGALNFHFGMAPTELNTNYRQPGEKHDEDNDGVPDEITEGEVSALTIFTMLCRPPTVEVPYDAKKRASAERGKALFGIFDNGQFKTETSSCTSCHRPQLVIDDSIVSVRDPRSDQPAVFLNRQGLIPSQMGGELPVLEKFGKTLEGRKANKAEGNELNKDRLKTLAKAFVKDPTKAGYYFDLSLKKGNSDPNERSVSLSYPRLPENCDGTIDVPLFSDLKRHNMGEGLADGFDQSTDRSYPVDSGDGKPKTVAIKVERHLFLTRSLWGVADSGPWLHDGRARTLREAIDLHKSQGSEANPAIEAFSALPDDQKRDLIEFLLTLRLSREGRYSADDDPGD